MDHLKEGFDPSTLTSAQLRNVLNQHNIQYSSALPKSELVELFELKITPNARTLLAEYNEKVKNSNDDGFVNASQEQQEEEREDKTPKGNKKKSKKVTPQPEIIVLDSETTENEREDEPSLKVSKTRTKKGTTLKSSISKTRKTSSRVSSSRAKSVEPSDEEGSGGSSSSSNRASRSRSNGATELNSLFDLDDSVLQVRKTSSKSKKVKSKPSKSSPKVSSKKEDKDEPTTTTKEKSKHDDSKISTPNPQEEKEKEEKEQTSFSKDNVFQSSSPSTVKKRKHTDDDDDNESLVRKRTVSSTKKLKKRETPAKVEKVEKSRFDDDDDSDLEMYEKFITKEDSVKDDSTSSIVTPSKLKSSKSRSTSSSNSKIVKPKSKPSSVKSTPSKLIKSSPVSSKDESFKSIKEENVKVDQHQQVDPELAKLLGITIQGFQPPVITIPLKEEISRKLALSEQDESTPIIKKKTHTPKKTPTTKKVLSSNTSSSRISTPKSSSDKSNNSTKIKSTPSSGRKHVTPKKLSPSITKSALTPKPRLLSLGSHKYETDDDEEEEEEEEEDEKYKNTKKTEVNLTKTSDENIIPSEIKKSKSFSFSFSFSGFVFSLLLWILIVGSGLFGLWYYEQKYSVGYCGQEIDQTTFGDSDNIMLERVGNFLDDNFKPKCINCPLHARCFANLEIGCFEDFMEYKPWFDFIIPGHKKCIPDTKKAEKLEIMIEVALDLLRSKNAALHCGLGIDDEESGIKLDDLHDLLLSMKAPYITLDEFEELWARSIIELEKEPDIEVRQKRSSNLQSGEFTFDINNTETTKKETNKILRSTSLSNISLSCQIHNSIVGGITEHKYRILSVFILLMMIKFIQIKYKNYELELIKIDVVYEEVLNKLKTQAQLAQQGREQEQEQGDVFPYIGSNQLRDLILSNENNLNQRLNIWKKVTDKVEKNSNVCHNIIEHHGEIMKVWEWIGII